MNRKLFILAICIVILVGGLIREALPAEKVRLGYLQADLHQLAARGHCSSMICNPKVLLMGEPFGSLDAQTRFNMQKFLLRIWNETRKSVLFVTHNVDEAIFLSQRIIIPSERPGQIITTVAIDIQYPGDINDPDFIQLRKKALEYIQS